jgi:hypothetical protein
MSRAARIVQVSAQHDGGRRTSNGPRLTRNAVIACTRVR